MTKHPTTVTGYTGSIDELAKAIGNMTYDKTAEFIEKLADDIKRQAYADKEKGRTQLACRLYQTAEELYSARDKMLEVWKVCKPYMQN